MHTPTEELRTRSKYRAATDGTLPEYFLRALYYSLKYGHAVTAGDSTVMQNFYKERAEIAWQMFRHGAE